MRDSLGGSDVEAVKSATERLATASQSLAERLYSQGGPSASAGNGAGAAGASQQPNDDEVVDAEIVDEPSGEHS